MEGDPGSPAPIDTKILIVSLGARLGPEGRYIVRGGHHSARNCGWPVDQSTYLAEDTQDGKFVLIRALVTTEPYRGTPIQGHEKMDATLRSLPGAHEHLLLHTDHFIHEDKAPYSCFVYELFGWDMQRLRDSVENDNLPGRWIWHVFKQSLSALAFLHKNGIFHGCIQNFAIITTFPAVDARDETAVFQLYPPPKPGHLQMWSNGSLGTGPSGAMPNLDFQIKLQLFGKASFVTDYTSEVKDVAGVIAQFSHFRCPPPELLEGRVGPEMDVWHLGEIIAEYISGLIEWATLLGGSDFGSLLYAEKVLGPLPERYRALAAAHAVTADRPACIDRIPSGTLLEVMHGHRSVSRNETHMYQKYGWGDFSEEEVRLAADLLGRMLEYDPDKRIGAAEALQHDFFRVPRPAKEYEL